MSNRQVFIDVICFVVVGLVMASLRMSVTTWQFWLVLGCLWIVGMNNYIK